MQKKIIALAVAGLVSGAAFAQSNVTIYGVMDGYYAHGSGNGNSVNVFNGNGGLSGSRLGFKGTEDLGGGLKAIWTLELGTMDFSVGDATNLNNDSTRQGFIGLTGNWGTFVGGRLQTPGYNFGAKYDAMGASIFSPVGQLTDNAKVGSGIGQSISGRDALARQNNSIAYVSPTMSGFTVVGAYSFGTGGENVDVNNTPAADPQNIWALSVDYDMGPLSLGYTHHNVNDYVGVSGVDQTENAFGVNYDFGMAKLSASYQTSKTDVGGANVADVKVWNIGARFKAGANGTVGVAYARLTDKNMGATTTDGRSNSWGVDYQHALSKRTTAYAGYSKVSNSNQAYGLQNLATTAAAGGKESQFAVGLRHTF